LEEQSAVSASVLDRAEALREVRSVFQSFELRLGVWIVIRDVRPAVGLGDLEVDEQRSNALRSHAGAAIGMEREGPGSASALSRTATQVGLDDTEIAATIKSGLSAGEEIHGRVSD
jgi:hypothetical protein